MEDKAIEGIYQAIQVLTEEIHEIKQVQEECTAEGIVLPCPCCNIVLFVA